ncbi:MAG: 50S ribosomal protein L24 [Gemmataceae bacterium]
MHVRKGDTVMVMVGDDKGTISRVLTVFPKKGKIVVEGVNRVYKHLKPNRQNPQGGRLSKEMPIEASNVMLVDPQTGEPTRVGTRYLPDGSKERYAKKSGASMGVIAPPRAAHVGKAE